MLTKCCSDSWFCLWGMNKFTACLSNTVRWKERKENREWEKRKEEEEKKLQTNKKEKEGVGKF